MNHEELVRAHEREDEYQTELLHRINQQGKDIKKMRRELERLEDSIRPSAEDEKTGEGTAQS